VLFSHLAFHRLHFHRAHGPGPPGERKPLPHFPFGKEGEKPKKPVESMKVETLLAGGGLSGLSCARLLHEKSRSYLLVEKEREAGGLCRTVFSKGFTFDCTGHFLHFNNPQIKEWVLGLMGDRLKVRRRHATIYSQGRYSEYPYQENNAGLPSQVVRENVLG